MRRLRLVETADAGASGGKDARMKVAFATNDMERVDAHFGGARNLAIYEVGADSACLVEAIQFDSDKVSGEDGRHSEEDRLRAKIDALKGCSLLFVLAIGGPAAARIVANRVHPAKLPGTEPISDVIRRVQGMMKGRVPPWLRKVMEEERDEMAFLREEA